MLKLSDERNARRVPIIFFRSSTGEDGAPSWNGSVRRMTPTVQRKKQNMSCLVDLSPISKNDITDVRNGLLIIRTVFDTGMNSKANIYSMKPKHEPSTLINA